MPDPYCAGKGEIICKASGLQSCSWVLSGIQEIAKHSTSPQNTRLDPFCMLSFNLVTNRLQVWCGMLT